MPEIELDTNFMQEEEIPSLMGLNAEEEKQFLIKEVMRLEDEEGNNEETTDNIINTMNVNKDNGQLGILQDATNKKAQEFGKNTPNKRGRKSFLDKWNMDGNAEE